MLEAEGIAEMALVPSKARRVPKKRHRPDQIFQQDAICTSVFQGQLEIVNEYRLAANNISPEERLW